MVGKVRIIADLTIQLIAMRLAAAAVLFGVQGLAIAAAAVLLNDPGPRYDGRLSLSPWAHLSLPGVAAFVLFGLGWGKPVEIDPKLGRAGLLAVVLTAFLAPIVTALILLALAAPALTTLPHAAALTLAAFFRVAALLCVWNALLSLLPMPPLAGGHLLALAGVRPGAKSRALLTAVMFVAIAAGLAHTVLSPAYERLAPIILGDLAGSRP